MTPGLVCVCVNKSQNAEDGVCRAIDAFKKHKIYYFHNLIHKLDRVTGKERAYANETLLV